jgi:hypothetical protein
MAEASRSFPAPGHADPMPGGYVVRDVNGQALAYLYSRDNEAEARQAKVLTKDEARRIAINIARLPELLGNSADLKTDNDWIALRETLEPQGMTIGGVRGILDRTRELGAISVVVEEEYLDQDFSAEPAAFYSRVFRRFPKLCRRFHFFSSEVTAVLNDADPQKVSEGLSHYSRVQSTWVMWSSGQYRMRLLAAWC